MIESIRQRRRLRREVRPFVAWLALVAATLIPARSAEAQLAISAETTSTIQGVAYADEEAPLIAIPGLSLDVGDLPQRTALSALGFDSGGRTHFVVETATTLPGGLVAEPRDVVRYDGKNFERVFDGSREGVPRNARIDGISFAYRRLFSFDTTVALAKGFVVADEDIVEWGQEGFVEALYFDGSSAGLDTALDIDAIDESYVGRVTVSFETAGTVDGLVFDDDDLLTYDETKAQWTFTHDLSEFEPTFVPGDVTGLVDVPEPDGWVALALGLLQITLWRRTTSARLSV